MREPFILRPPEARGGNDRQLREAIGQRSSPAQMLTELCCMLANLGSTDQQLERPAKSPPPSGNNQIVNSALGLGHLRVSDFMITGHRCILSAWLEFAPAPLLHANAG